MQGGEIFHKTFQEKENQKSHHPSSPQKINIIHSYILQIFVAYNILGPVIDILLLS